MNETRLLGVANIAIRVSYNCLSAAQASQPEYGADTVLGEVMDQNTMVTGQLECKI